jgi:hypothetical protein
MNLAPEPDQTSYLLNQHGIAKKSIPKAESPAVNFASKPEKSIVSAL